MNRFAFSAFFVAAAITGILNNAAGQMMNATVQTTSPRVVVGRSGPTTAAKPVPAARPAPQVVPRPTGINPQRFNSNLPRGIARSPVNVQRSYLPPLQTSNPAFAALNVPRNGQTQQPISVDPAVRQTELRPLAAMRQRRGVVTREGNILDPATRQNETYTLAAMREHRGLGPRQQANTPDSTTGDTELRTLERIRERRTLGTNDHTLATIDPERHACDRDIASSLAHRASIRNDGDASIHHSSRDLDGPRKERLSAKCDLLVLAREELEIAFSSESAVARWLQNRTSYEFPKELVRSSKRLSLRIGLPELCIGAFIFNYGKHAGIQVV